MSAHFCLGQSLNYAIFRYISVFYVVGWGKMLQARRLRVPVPIRALSCFVQIYLILSAALGPLVYSAYNRNEYQKHKKKFWEVERGRCVRLTILLPSVSKLSRQYGILNVPQPYRHPWPVTGMHCVSWDVRIEFICYVEESRPPLLSSGQSSWLQNGEVVGLERSPLSLVSTIEELLERKSGGSGLGNREYGSKDPSCWIRGTLYPQKLAISSPTSGDLSVGIVHLETNAKEFSSV
jgi:hypothetical protein